MSAKLSGIRVCVIGLGYVGLPIAVEFGKKFNTVGFDISAARIKKLSEGIDQTLEITANEMAESTFLEFTGDLNDLNSGNVFIVTVPTPLDKNRKPDLSPLLSASKLVGGALNSGDYVIYESTVYPGATEEDCIPVLEATSGLTLNKDFFVGYSPERINPGDKTRTLTNITKVTSGSNAEAADFVDALYRSIILAGTYKASSIKVAEAAKVIENTQRDLNIALTNELAIIFNTLGIDTNEVLQAAGSKWNFIPFKPGLVGGHCIGVDPYYLTSKAESVGYYPEVILAGRRINDNMGKYVVGVVIKEMLKARIHVNGSKILVMGLTFKENCPDIRNTKVTDLVHEFAEYGAEVDVFDPWVDVFDAEKQYGISLIPTLEPSTYDAIILAVPHEKFVTLGPSLINSYGKDPHIFYDLKSVFPDSNSRFRL